ncbi:unnamed protein product [Mytilus coruscus]|uniref:Uncharacterized protein n=1 Tax=Mytilus coruscus TaxID=42192 RepID=A0A6J8BM17_MYTCO|nr:unnamed protein product [Mytilus coruscus]
MLSCSNKPGLFPLLEVSESEDATIDVKISLDDDEVFTKEEKLSPYYSIIKKWNDTAVTAVLKDGNAATQEEVNFLRIYLLCMKLGTDAVRLLFDKHVPKSALATHLSTFRNPKGFFWYKHEKKLLFQGGPVTSTAFDTSLLYKLIRHTLNGKIVPPSSGWGSRPLPGDKLPSDDIELVRHYRNKISHPNAEFKISDEEFWDQWNELSEDGLIDLQDAVIHCRRDIEETSKRHIPDHIREYKRTVLDEWKRLDIVFCRKTRVYETSYEEVKKLRTVTFIGGPGSGKTATARHIALVFERSGWEVIPVCKGDEIILYGNSKIRQVFLLDDVFGNLSFNMSKFNDIASCENNFLKSISENSKIFFTCRKTVYNEAIELKPFVLENIVDLGNKTNELNEKEKRNILTNHCVKAGVDKKFYINLSLTNAKIMFPFLCHLFAIKKKNQMLGSNFFAKPFEYLLEEMNKLQKTNTAQYVSLVLCLVNNKKLSIDNMPSKHVKKEVYNSCGLDRGTADRKIFDALSNIEGTYVMKVENEYSFIHDSIYETIAYHYGQKFQEQILEYMPSNFIANKVIVFGNHSYDDLNILITEGNFSKLAERLYLDLESDQLFDVFMNKALTFQPFLDVFIQIMKKKPYKAFKKIFLAPSIGICHHLINWKEKDKDDRGNDGHDYSVEAIRRKADYYDEARRKELLTDKREEEGEKEHGVSKKVHRIRVISWIVYYGHTQLLEEIVNHVRDHNESTDEVFDSHIEDQARLLVLAVYNGDPHLIEQMLKYVKKESINATPMYDSDDYLNANYHRTLSPLTAACQFDNLRIIELLVQSGACVNLIDYNYMFPLYVASKNGKYKIVKYLVQNGANVNKSEALSIATMYEYFDVVNCLVQAGADVNMIGLCNMTPIFQATLFGYTEIVRFLVENGADVNICDDNNKSPLFAASEQGHSDIVLYLIKNGGDVNMCDDQGKSPFLASIENGHFDVVKTFVDNNVLVNIHLSNKRLPLKLALLKGRVEIATFLLQNGSDYRMKKECEVSTMQIALWKNHFDILHQIVSLENRREPFIGNLQLFQLLVDLCEFQVFPRTSCSINMNKIYDGTKFRDRSLALLFFISEVIDRDGIKQLLKLGLGSNLDTEKKHLLLEYAITEPFVLDRVEKVKSLFDVYKSFNVRDHNSVSLLECTRKLFERKNTQAADSAVGNIQHEIGNQAVRTLDLEEYRSTLSFLKQRVRRFSV